jgi:hypothetical protein
MTPADAERAHELEQLYADLFDAETRGLHGALTLVTMMAFLAASLYRPALTALAVVTVVGCLVMIRRAVRRRRNLQVFCRDARLVDARIIPPSTRPDHFAGWYMDLAIPDDDRAVVARVRRRWPRTSLVPDPERVTAWYAPTSSIVISFDPRGEPVLGRIQKRPLPIATIAQR